MTSRNIMDQFRRGLDRASFEADRLMRYNRVRAEAGRIRQQARERTLALGEKVLELHQAHNLTDPALLALAREIGELNTRVDQKEAEATAIQKEDWVDPGTLEPDADPQIGANSGPAPRAASGGDPQIGASSGPAPTPLAAHIAPDAAGEPGGSFCPACGTALRAQATFCPHCGMKQA
jgi:hypothetical protein